MEEMFRDTDKEDEENSQSRLNKDIELEDNSSTIPGCKLESLIGRIKPEEILVSDIKKNLTDGRCIQKSVLQIQYCLYLRVPKYISFVNLDEKYLHRRLCLVRFGETNSSSVDCTPSVSCNISMDVKSSKMVVLVDHLKLYRSKCEVGSFVVRCPLQAGFSRWILGTGEGTEYIKNVKGQLLGQLDSLGSTSNLAIAGPADVKGTIKSSLAVNTSLQQKLEQETRKYDPDPFYKRLVSVPKSIHTYSQKSSFPPATTCQGMLQCVWKCGIPHFMFSVDDQKEMYIANMLKVEPLDYKDLDYAYFFHSKIDGKKEQICDNAFDVVGKMNVSSSFTLCSDSSKIMETEFVLFGADVKYCGNKQTPDTTHLKYKGSPKLMDAISAMNFWKHRSSAKFDGQSCVPEFLSTGPFKGTSNKPDIPSELNLLDDSPNNELAAIIVKEHLQDNRRDTTVGGWGLKFLEKCRVDCASSSQVTSASSGSFHGQSDCSTRMNVVIPSGFHGGPQTRNGGPSRLTDRWRSGGRCDCGGWDLGCSLIVLNNSSSKDLWTQTESQEECKAIHLIIEGSKQGEAPLKMVNIHDGLYRIHFQSTLSALQSFSIGVAIIHSQSPTLSSKPVQKKKN